MCSTRKLHFKLSGIQGLLIGVGRNPERDVVVMYNNVDLISETYKDIPMAKVQIRRFNHPLLFDDRDHGEKMSNIYK